METAQQIAAQFAAEEQIRIAVTAVGALTAVILALCLAYRVKGIHAKLGAAICGAVLVCIVGIVSSAAAQTSKTEAQQRITAAQEAAVTAAQPAETAD